MGLLDLPRATRWLLFANVLTFVGIGFTAQYSILYLVQGRGHELGAATGMLGLAGLVGAISTPVAGWLVDRFGTRGVILVSTVMWAVMIALYALQSELWMLGLLLALSSLAMNVRFTAFGSALGLINSPAQRPRVMSFNFAGLNLGIGIGGLLGGFLLDVRNPASFSLLFLLQALMIITLLPFARMLPGRQTQSESQRIEAMADGGWGVILRDRRLWMLCLLALILWFVISQQNYLLPVLATRLGASTRVLGIALGLNTFGIALLQMPVYRLVRDWPRARALQLMFATMLVGWAALLLASRTENPLWLAALVIVSPTLVGIGETFFSPTLPPTLMEIAPRSQIGRYNGLFSLSIATCNITAPLATGYFLGNDWGPQLLLLLMALCVLGMVLAPGLMRTDDGGRVTDDG